MMSVLWLIIKIALLFLLALLGIALLILLAVLLVPVRYRAEASCYGHLKADVRVSWLLHILSLHITYQEAADMSIRIFGFRLRGRTPGGGAGPEVDFPGDWPEDEDFMVSSQSASPLPEDTSALGRDSTGKGPAGEGAPAGSSQDREPEEADGAGGEQKSRSSGRPRKSGKRRQIKGPLSMLREMIQRVRAAIKRVLGKIRHIREHMSEAKDWLENPKTREMFRLVWKEARALLRHILPRRGRGRITVGFDDPYLTGRFLSVAGLLYPVYRDRIQIYPVFDRPVLEGEFWLKGRIRALTLLLIGFRLWRNETIRKIIRR